MGKFQTNQSTRGQKFITQSKSEAKVKRPFDKAKWREQKYSNKAKVNRFEERRKKTVLREYYKELKRSGVALNCDTQTSGTPSFHKDEANRKRPLKPHEMARIEAVRIKQEQDNKRLEKQRILEERKKALNKYKKKRKDHFSKLSKKTQRGQPVMAGRMEMLLEKIQKGM